MVIQTVTILVLAGINAVLLAALTFSFWRIYQAARQLTQYQLTVDEYKQELARKTAETEALTESNSRLRFHIERIEHQIPLAPRTKAVDNQPKQARTSGDVRRMTEQAFTERPQVPLVQGDGSN